MCHLEDYLLFCGLYEVVFAITTIAFTTTIYLHVTEIWKNIVKTLTNSFIDCQLSKSLGCSRKKVISFTDDEPLCLFIWEKKAFSYEGWFQVQYYKAN